jgi:hypothetical protein
MRGAPSALGGSVYLLALSPPALADEVLVLRAEDDQSGAPLPAGAVRRLGSVPYRLPARCEGIAWSAGQLRAATPHGLATLQPDGRVTLDPNIDGYGLASAPDGVSVAYGIHEGDLAVVDLRTGRNRHRKGPGGEVFDLVWMPDGRLAAVVGSEPPESSPGERYIVTENLAFVSVWEPRRARPTQVELSLCSDARVVPFEGELAVVCRWGTLYRVDPSRGRAAEMETFSRPSNVWASPDGQTLVVAGEEGFEIHRGATLQRGDMSVFAAAVAGERVALGGDGRIEVKGEPALSLELPHGWVSSLAWRGDGQILAACAGNRVAWWDADSGELSTPWTGHAGEVTAVALSADGRTAVSGSDRGEVILWDVERGQERARWLLPGGALVKAVSWSQGAVEANTHDQTHRWVVAPEQPEGPHAPYTISAQSDGTLLIIAPP